MTEPAPAMPEAGRELTPRQRWMAVLARASCAELEALLDCRGGPPPHTALKAPEVGTVMIEGRAGGTGVRFNLGEATVARAVVLLGSGTIGFACALGTDRRKALLAALVDGLLQDGGPGCAIHQRLALLAGRQAAKREHASRKAAATKVEFFTMVRGND